MNSAA